MDKKNKQVEKDEKIYLHFGQMNAKGTKLSGVGRRIYLVPSGYDGNGKIVGYEKAQI